MFDALLSLEFWAAVVAAAVIVTACVALRAFMRRLAKRQAASEIRDKKQRKANNT